MPEGEVCCETYYCFGGQTCAANRKCRNPSGGGGGDGGDKNGPATSSSLLLIPTITARPVASTAVEDAPEPTTTTTMKKTEGEEEEEEEEEKDDDDSASTSDVFVRTSLAVDATPTAGAERTTGLAALSTTAGGRAGRVVGGIEGAVLVMALFAAAPLVI
ncbi:hypothetical protein LX36DRAFT_658065 [Colletotrichum falcatum]|nr:hypothetical protein LX36DRAFT_658065 [Colletotrichum falcatum]